MCQSTQTIVPTVAENGEFFEGFEGFGVEIIYSAAAVQALVENGGDHLSHVFAVVCAKEHDYAEQHAERDAVCGFILGLCHDVQADCG